MTPHSSPRMALAGVVVACGIAASGAAAQGRQVSINGVWQTPAQIQQAERAAGVRLPNGHYWYDAGSGLWGRLGGPPLGRVRGAPSAAGANAGHGGRYAGGDLGSDGRCSYFNSPSGSVMTGDC